MEKKFIVNNAVDEILLTENQKVSSVREAPDYLDSGYDDNNVYQVDKISLEETKEKLECISVCLNTNINIHILLKIEMI